jgi:hypothetical protein
VRQLEDESKIARLALGLFVERDDPGPLGRGPVEPDDVDELLCECGVVLRP